MGFLGKLFGIKEKESLDQGLQQTKEGFFAKITKAIAGKSTVDDEVLDNLEEALIGADVGMETTIQIIERIEKRISELLMKYPQDIALPKLINDKYLTFTLLKFELMRLK